MDTIITILLTVIALAVGIPLIVALGIFLGGIGWVFWAKYTQKRTHTPKMLCNTLRLK